VALTELSGFVLGSLAVWRVTHLLHAEDGPWDAMARLRQAAGHGGLGQALDCFACLSLWVAAPVAFALGPGGAVGGLLWLALSGAAMLLEAWRAGHEPLPFHVEDKES
jgi:hypothetical protein